MGSFVSRFDRTVRRDLASGLFFSGVGLVGFSDIYGNARLMNTLGQGPDPGPALLPLVVLGLIIFGGSVLLLKGFVAWALHRPRDDKGSPRDPAMFSRHAHAAALLASLIILPSVVMWLGFMAAAWLFAAPWLVWLEYRRSHSRYRALLLGITTAALLALSLHLIFITLLGVAL